ncbi:hypothetical protein A1O1_01508 [Capronia coronata CBS 617.96]|uniref:gamma-glutamylcyclotransferase n=1 Tax=Capronia coronata CBS 617.96 TaxID=1182541 RepID=W9YU26_9EURO|nr:uncharacterized protein A1O1_01508 [Capronia coronata CBS 617.96]EXJ96382.1 hypothetical protein A1O1_01508 [Capronia coronata CBS 617.96]
MDGSGPILSSLQQWLDIRNPLPVRKSYCTQQIPTTSAARQHRSLDDVPFDLTDLSSLTVEKDSAASTVLYLGYGSNLSAETFRGKRDIKPLSQVNVVVPSLSLTFDLPGIPYTEPCFANVRYRDASVAGGPDDHSRSQDYHKDRWPKGLVGVVYEVTKEDYAHIIATEGGGSGYQDVVVDCFALNGGPTEDVPWKPSGHAFKAHTLFAPPTMSRPDPSYAQPSPRYLKLITDGAVEHGLPLEYQAFLHQIRTYHLTTTQQRLGSYIFLSVWSPFFLFILLGGAAMFLKPNGRYPKWLSTFVRALFTACWASYDNFFKNMFGDGERTIEDIEDLESGVVINEKSPLYGQAQRTYGAVEVMERIV